MAGTGGRTAFFGTPAAAIPALAALAAATGGQVEPARLILPRAAGSTRTSPLAAWSLLLALLLLPVDASLRRPVRLAL